ncbi:MAG: hypothetical protein C0407_06425 [Desulfobacca sp.]|nr:hypothetical protein [Desulfobacca sp.]
MTKPRRLLALFVSVFLFLSVFNAGSVFAAKKRKSAPRMDKDRVKIMQIVKEWVPALRSGDVERITAFFTEDIVIVGSKSQEIYAGQNEVKKLLTQILDNLRPEECSIKIQSIQVNGEWAELYAKFSAAWEPKKEGIKAAHEANNYLWVLKHQSDGSWKIARFLFYPE